METSLAFTSETSEKMASHLNKTFGIVFPPELATRLLTHASHPVSKVVGHNARFAFIGECSCLVPSTSLPRPSTVSHFRGFKMIECLTRLESRTSRD